MLGERFYIRILLNHVKNAQSFNDLRTTVSSSTSTDEGTDTGNASTTFTTTSTRSEDGAAITTSITTTITAGTTTIVTTISTLHASYKAACIDRGLLMGDEEWDRFLTEAATFTTLSLFRQLFATVLIECNPQDPLVSLVLRILTRCLKMQKFSLLIPR